MAQAQITIRSITSSLIAIAALSYLAACGAEQKGASGLPSVWAPTPTPTPSPTPSPTPVSSTDKFRVKADFPTGVPNFMHVDGDATWTTKCEISPTETDPAKKDLVCYLDVQELDLFFHDFSLKSAAPAGLCSYLRVKPYWFYAKRAGRGPTEIEYTKSAETGVVSNVVIQTTDGSASYTGDGWKCAYDYAADGATPAANCCSGSWVEKQNLIPVRREDPAPPATPYPAPTPVAQAPVVRNWEGKYGNCAHGPAASSDWVRLGSQDLPAYQLYWAHLGVEQSVKIKSPLWQGIYSNIYASNYLEDFNTPPAALDSATGIQATPAYAPNIYYDYQCLDHADEIKQRIRVVIREWNMAVEFAKKGAGDPDLTGAESDFPSDDLNDVGDWKDFQALPGFTYPGFEF